MTTELGASTRLQPRFRSREVAALLLLPFGGFLYLVGWAVGVALLWKSDRWTRFEKLLGTLVLPFGYLPMLMLGSWSGRTCATPCSSLYFPDWFTVPVLGALGAAPLVMLFVLIHNARPGRSATD